MVLVKHTFAAKMGSDFYKDCNLGRQQSRGGTSWQGNNEVWGGAGGCMVGELGTWIRLW